MTPLVLTLCPQDDSILLNQGVIDTLGRPRQIQILLSENHRKLVLRACSIDDIQAWVIPPEHIEMHEIGAFNVLHKISAAMGWGGHTTRACLGDFLPDSQAILFDLSTAQEVIDTTPYSVKPAQPPVNPQIE